MMKIFVRVITNSTQEQIEKSGNGFKVWLKSKPIENKANKALIKIVARHFHVLKGNVTIVSGLKSRDKIIEVFEDGS